MEGDIAIVVPCHIAERLPCTDLLPDAYGDGREVAVDCQITSVTYNDMLHASHIKYGGYLAIEDATCLRTGLAGDVDTLIVEIHALQPFGIDTAEPRCDDVASGDRDR